MSHTYNLFAELKKNISDFNDNKLSLVHNLPASELSSARNLGNNSKGLSFSQRDTTNIIRLYLNSTFETGKYDTERQRKVFLNIVRFIRDVARMRTDIDVKNYVFNPDTYEDFWPTYFMQRQFKVWTRENNYGETLNGLGDDYTTYGTAVSKRVGKTVERTPITSLINTQDAESLNKAAKTGGYVIEEHEYTLTEMQGMKGWNTEGLEHGKKYKCFERYTLVPRYVIDRHNGETTDDEEMVLAMQILIPDEKGEKGTDGGHICFLEEVNDTPYEEVWWEKVDGRWLGRGPVEAQLENQVARNITANLRRRSLLWASKKIFQTQGEDIAKNLIRDVKDGQVLEVGPNGLVTQLDTTSRAIGEFQSDEQVWDKNSQQMSFTFEVATGESMPSGTPFRLGVILNQAVETYYSLKKEQFGLFLKRAYYSQMIPIFKKQTAEHTILVAQGAEGYEHLKEAMVSFHTRKRMFDSLLQRDPIDVEALKAQVSQEIERSPFLYADVPEKFYDEAKFRMELDITDEANDTTEQVQTLTTIWQGMVQAQDPRADRVLETILTKTGKNLTQIAGKKEVAPQPQLTPQNALTA